MKLYSKPIRNLRIIYSSRDVFGSSNIDTRLWDSDAGHNAQSKLTPLMQQTVSSIANQLTLDRSDVDSSVIQPSIYATITNCMRLRDKSYDGVVYSVYLNVVVDYGKYAVDTTIKPYEIQEMYYLADGYRYLIYDDGNYKLDYKSRYDSPETPEYILKLLSKYRKYGPSGGTTKFFDNYDSAKRFKDSISNYPTTSNTGSEIIEKSEIISDAKEFLQNRPGIQYKYSGVISETSDLTLDDLENGNYSDGDRIVFRVDVSYRGNTSFLAVTYQFDQYNDYGNDDYDDDDDYNDYYIQGEWICITTNYDFSDEAAEILCEIKYPLS